MNDMMHSTGALIALVVIVLVVLAGLFTAVRIAGARVNAGDEPPAPPPPADDRHT